MLDVDMKRATDKQSDSHIKRKHSTIAAQLEEPTVKQTDQGKKMERATKSAHKKQDSVPVPGTSVTDKPSAAQTEPWKLIGTGLHKGM